MKRSAANSDALEDRERNVVSFELNNNSRFEEAKNRFNPLNTSGASNLIYQSNKSKIERPSVANSSFRPEDSFNRNSTNNGSSEHGVYIQEEIRPGIILEGYAVEI